MKDFPVERLEYQGASLRVEGLPLGVKRLVLARPSARNAFDETMIGELSAALAQLAAIPAAEVMRLLILAGEGEAFCAGADLAYMKEQAERGEAASLEDARNLGRLFFALASFPAPVVCAVQGAAIGGGLGLTACADYVLAQENAIFSTTEVRLGIVPAVISPYLVRKIGLGRAAPFMLSGRRLTAREALELGLVQQLVHAEGEAALQEVVLEFLQAGPHAARRTKELLRAMAPLPDPTLLDFTAQNIARARSSEEGRLGLESFFTKATPPWAVEAKEIQRKSRAHDP